MERDLHDKFCQKLDIIINESIKKHIFTACSLGFFALESNDGQAEIYSYGTAAKAGRKVPLENTTFFDLASLTKPLVTALSILSLVAEGKCGLEDQLNKFFHLQDSAHKGITLHHLLSHSSGLPAHQPYYKKLVTLPEDRRMSALIDWILAEKLLFMPGTDSLYSDLGFIILGKIVEIASGFSLDSYWRRTITEPLRLENDLFFAAKEQKDMDAYVPTAGCQWSATGLYGHVNDENCRALGGVAGHAGLFGTTRGVLALCRELLQQYKGKAHHTACRMSHLKEMFRWKKGPWVLGFDTPTPPLSSSGKYFSQKSIGHLGFTGTSFWVDVEKDVAVVLLTNRVFCSDNVAAIKKIRPILHDIVMEMLLKKTLAG